MYDFLRPVFGTDEKGNEVPLTFSQFVEKLGSAEGVELVNLAEGGYVPGDRYDADVGELKNRMEAQERDFAERSFLSGYKFTSKAAENGVLAELKAKNFRVEDGRLAGAEEFMDSLMENEDYKAAFMSPEPAPAKPVFSAGTNAATESRKTDFHFGFTHLR